MTGLGSLTWVDVARRAPRVLVVPVGSCEQHGPHLPLDTDTRIAVAVAEAAAAGNDRAVVAPPVTIGASGEHAGFAGTISVGTKVLAEVLTEIVRSASATFASIVVINAHGGNAEALAAAAATADHDRRRLVIHHVALPGGDAHAGRDETSLVAAIAPGLVRTDELAPGNTTPLPGLIERLRAEGVAAVSASGVLGDPSGASSEEGRDLLAELVAAASEVLAGECAAAGG